MIAALLLASAFPRQESTRLELYRGAEIAPAAGKPFRYFAVADTTLDSQQPERNFGGEYTLTGGRGHTILIRFGDLERAVGHSRVVKASLVLTPFSSDKPVFAGAGRILTPWGEGPMLVVGRLVKPGAKAEILEWAANWKFRRSGENGIAWQQPGALGPSDAASIPNAKLVPYSQEEVAIEGLEGAVQAMVDRPEENNGFELLFDQPTEFFSTQGRSGRPRLVLELAPQTPAIGPDLSVTMIDRSPEYPRGVSPDAKHWPSDGKK